MCIRDSFLVLDLGLDVVDSVGRLHLEGDRLTGQGLDENLHIGLSAARGASFLPIEVRWEKVMEKDFAFHRDQRVTWVPKERIQ